MPPDLKLTDYPPSVHEKFQSAATIADEIRGTEVSVLALCLDEELPPEAIFLDSTTISLAPADSYDEEGVALPRG